MKETRLDRRNTISNDQKDDALFESLGKSKKRKRRKIIITILVIVLVLVITAFIVINSLKQKVTEQFALNTDEVLSYEVTTGSISTVVSGSGTLSDVDLTELTVPAGVEITEVLVETNDTVSEGDIIANINMSSVLSSMAEVQSEIDELDESISDTEDDETSNRIYAGVSGRVKIIYAQADDIVTDVMYENDALAVLSLDGYMAVDVETNSLITGDSVTVKLSDDEEVSGTVDTVSNGVATVLVSDNGPEYDEAVTVFDSDGSEVGCGNLYIHCPLKVSGYAGTISSVCVNLNSSVTDDTALFSLVDTSYSANYYALLRERSEKEDTLVELLKLQRDGALLSSISGSVSSVDYDENYVVSTEETQVVTLSPDEKMSVTISVDESDILALEQGQEVTVTVSSIGEDEFSGTLTEIDRTSTSSGTYSAKVELNKEEGMLSGMTADVSVRIEGVDDAIIVPAEAVHLTSDGAYVYTSYDEETEEYGGKVDVVTGLENSSYVEIKEGLAEGQTVYYTEEQDTMDFGSMGMPEMGGGDFAGGDLGNSDFGGNMPDAGSMHGGGNFPGRSN